MKVKDLFSVCENYFSFILVVNSKNRTEVDEEYHDDPDTFYDMYADRTIDKFIIYDSTDPGDTGAVLEITLK